MGGCGRDTNVVAQHILEPGSIPGRVAKQRVDEVAHNRCPLVILTRDGRKLDCRQDPVRVAKNLRDWEVLRGRLVTRKDGKMTR